MAEQLRAVIADDSFVWRGRFAAAVQLAGAEVVGTARSGQEALKLCLELKPDLAIFDVAMPPSSGSEAATELAEKKVVRTILVVSSNSQDMVFAPLHALGVKTLTKPCGDDALRSAVKAICDGLA